MDEITLDIDSNRKADITYRAQLTTGTQIQTAVPLILAGAEQGE